MVLFSHVRLVFPGTRVAPGRLLVEGARIAAIDPPDPPPDAQVVDGQGRLLTPGLIDLHTHGIERFAFDQGPEALVEGAARFAAHGTTTLYPTLVPRRTPEVLDRVRRAAEALARVRGVNAPGLHLEGPFMALPGAGCEVAPGDVAFLDELLDAGQGRVAIMSLSPDTPGILPVIERLHERGVVPFVTHTQADAAQTRAAIDAGARHATHLYDVFPAPPECEPGVRPAGAVEVFLADPRATVDVIADGCHADPVVIRLAVAAKGPRGVVLITDSSIGAGLPAGTYPTPWGFSVRVVPGQGARIADSQHSDSGALAASALTLNAAVGNVLRWLDLPAEQVWAMATANPARVAGLTDRGRIEVGTRADLVLWNESLTPARVWVAGQEIYRREVGA